MPINHHAHPFPSSEILKSCVSRSSYIRSLIFLRHEFGALRYLQLISRLQLFARNTHLARLFPRPNPAWASLTIQRVIPITSHGERCSGAHLNFKLPNQEFCKTRGVLRLWDTSIPSPCIADCTTLSKKKHLLPTTHQRRDQLLRFLCPTMPLAERNCPVAITPTYLRWRSWRRRPPGL